MAGTPKCPECATPLIPVGNAWRCDGCCEYFANSELQNLPTRPRRERRSWHEIVDDDY